MRDAPLRGASRFPRGPAFGRAAGTSILSIRLTQPMELTLRQLKIMRASPDP